MTLNLVNLVNPVKKIKPVFFLNYSLFIVHYSLSSPWPLGPLAPLREPDIFFPIKYLSAGLSLRSLGEGGRRTPQFNLQSRQIGTKLIIFFRFFALFHFFSPLFIKTTPKPHHFLTQFLTF
jgi:hypothetical protein